jgi:DNA-binding CsgD family transcriptional regulator
MRENTDHHAGSAPTVSESDTRAMVRLLAEIAVMEGSIFDKRNRLMEGLCDLVGADAWLWMKLGRETAGEAPTFSILQKKWAGESEFVDFLRSLEHPDMKSLMAPLFAEFAEKRVQLTRLRQQIDPENRFPESETYDLWRKADVGPMLLSFRPTADGQTTSIALYRRFDRDLFEPRESRIAHVLLSEVNWLYEETAHEATVKHIADLSPRLNTVHNLLLQGLGRKQIAAELDITINTVNGYARDLYRRFNVHSQSELIRRFVDGDGGDRP